MKLLWIGMLAACSAAGSEAPSTIDAASSDAQTIDGPAAMFAPLEVLTINLKTPLPSDDTLDQRTAMVAALIAAEQPDVIALQEVTRSASLANRAEVLAAMTGYAWTWRPTHQLVIGEEGIAIMTRGQITWQADAELPHTEFGALHRAILGARITVGDRSVELFATHLTVAGSTDDRADQIAAARAFVDVHHQVGVPAYFAGDLNAEPAEITPQLAPFVDAAAAAGPTHPSDGPDRRIDYIFALPGSGTPTSCATVLANATNGVRASDHLGVLCRFE